MKIFHLKGPSFWISPEENLFETPMLKLISKYTHKRYNSGKLTPMKENSGLIKKKSSISSINSQQSPKNPKKPKNSSSKRKKSKKPENKSPLPPLKKKKKIVKKGKISEKLQILKGKLKLKAPKIFSNQIFVDVYDEKGNHDRIFETFEVSKSFDTIYEEKRVENGQVFIIPETGNNFEYDETEFKSKMKQPENSFTLETKEDLKIDNNILFSKLTQLVLEREQDST